MKCTMFFARSNNNKHISSFGESAHFSGVLEGRRQAPLAACVMSVTMSSDGPKHGLGPSVLFTARVDAISCTV